MADALDPPYLIVVQRYEDQIHVLEEAGAYRCQFVVLEVEVLHVLKYIQVFNLGAHVQKVEADGAEVDHLFSSIQNEKLLIFTLRCHSIES